MVNTPITWKYDWEPYEDRYSLWAEADSHHSIDEDIEKFSAHVCNVPYDLVPEGEVGYSLVASMTAELVLTWLGYGELYKLLPDADVRRVVMNEVFEVAMRDDRRWEQERAHNFAVVLTA